MRRIAYLVHKSHIKELFDAKFPREVKSHHLESDLHDDKGYMLFTDTGSGWNVPTHPYFADHKIIKFVPKRIEW